MEITLERDEAGIAENQSERVAMQLLALPRSERLRFLHQVLDLLVAPENRAGCEEALDAYAHYLARTPTVLEMPRPPHQSY